MQKNIFDLDNKQAEDFFYTSEVYFHGELPSYFNFRKMLTSIKDYYDVYQGRIKIRSNNKNSNVNYDIYINKDNGYVWRRLQLINPIMYVDLVKYITETRTWTRIVDRVKKLQEPCKDKIICTSIPIVKAGKNKTIKSAQIFEWWESFEQNSLKCGAEFLYVYTTDITDCYACIYTKSIAWALHNKCIIDSTKKRNLVGKEICKKLENMQGGETIGLSQGSTLMNVISEILFAYIDRKLYYSLCKYKDIEYKILRYRDDYKIFVNSKEDGDIILQNLANILKEFNLKVNSSKTTLHDDIIIGSLKKDKYKSYKIETLFLQKNLQKKFMLLHSFLEEFPLSRQVAKWITTINDEIRKSLDSNQKRLNTNQCEVLIGMCSQLAYKNPTLLSYFLMVISTLLSALHKDTAVAILKKIYRKFSTLPNNTSFKLFFQRIALAYEINDSFDEKICDCVVKSKDNKYIQMNLWNFDFLKEPPESFMKNIYKEKFIFLRPSNTSKRIAKTEVDFFATRKYH